MSSVKPSQIAKDVYHSTVIRVTHLVGTNLETDPEINKRIVFFYLIIINCGVMLVNGFVHLEANFKQFCQVGIFLNLMCQLIARAFNRNWANDEIIAKRMLKRLEKFYDKHEGSYQDVLYGRNILIARVLKIFFYFYFLIFYVPIITCWILFFVNGDYVTIVPFPYPFTTVDTLHGYLFNMLLVTFSVAFIVISLAGMAYSMPYFGAQVIPMVDVLSIKLQQFKDKIDSEKVKIGEIPRPKLSMSLTEQQRLKKLIFDAFMKMNQKVHEDLLETLVYINEYKEFVDEILSFMRLISFIAVATNAISLGLAVLYMLTLSIPIGLGLIFVYFCEILVPCLIGTIIAHQNDRISKKLWAFPWYELSHSDQKIFLQLIHLCQNLNDLNLPMFKHVNMELLREIIFGAYSYYTYTLNFVEL